MRPEQVTEMPMMLNVILTGFWTVFCVGSVFYYARREESGLTTVLWAIAAAIGLFSFVVSVGIMRLIIQLKLLPFN